MKRRISLLLTTAVFMVAALMVPASLAQAQDQITCPPGTEPFFLFGQFIGCFTPAPGGGGTPLPPPPPSCTLTNNIPPCSVPAGTPCPPGTVAGRTFTNPREVVIECVAGLPAPLLAPGGVGTSPSTTAAGCSPASQEFSERRITSGPASPTTRIANEGNNVNLSPTAQQTAQTGNVANEQGVVQSCSEAGDIDFSGSSLEISPTLDSTGTQTTEQVAGS